VPIETVGKPPESWNASESQVHNSTDFLLWQLITILEILVPLIGNFSDSMFAGLLCYK